MKNKLFVGGLSWDTKEDGLKAFFEKVGPVLEVKIIYDKFNNNRSKGFGFVTMENEDLATKAVEELNGENLDGRALNVSYARPEQKTRGGGRNFDRGNDQMGE